MNRRSFLDAMLKGVATFTILPSAGRIWKAERQVIGLYDKFPYHMYYSHTFRFLPSFQDFIIRQQKDAHKIYKTLIMGEWPPNKTEVTQCPIFSDLNERQPIRQISTVRVRV